jgi:hypothetical protein
MPVKADGTVHINITHEDRLVPICDFCNAPAVAHSYPCRSFSLPEFATESVTDWAVCEPCAALIEAGDRIGLAVRSVETILARLPERPDRAGLLHITEFIAALHFGFHAHRTGPRVAPPPEFARP